MRSRGGAWSALLLGAIFTMATPAALRAQRIGICFDRQGTSCSASIASFGTLDLFIVAFPEPGQQLVGATFKLRLPTDIVVSDDPAPSFPRDIGGTMTGTLGTGLDIQFFPCRDITSPVVLLEMQIFERNTQARNNLVLELVGSAQDSVTAVNKPTLKLCDPENPEGDAGRIEVAIAQGHLNCTGTCPCTVAVASRTWGALKSLYREP
jgi:hypothetical protein